MSYFKILTDPRKHDPDNFVYIVHGIDAARTRSDAERMMGAIRDPSAIFSASLVGRLGYDASGRLGIPHSVEHLHTISDYGIIVGLSDDSPIRVAWLCDISSRGKKEEIAEKRRGKIINPLIMLTESVGHNELLLQGGEKTTVTGVFYREHHGQMAREFARVAGLPAIRLPYAREEPDEVDVCEAYLEFRGF